MKIEINIEKKHLFIFVGFLVLIVGGYVIAQGSYTGGIPTSGVGHQDLYVSHIYPWTEKGAIKINTLDIGDISTTYARLDFENNSNNFWTVMYKTNPNRLLISYKDPDPDIGWVDEVASFREDGSLWLREGKICDDSTESCYEISDLPEGGGSSKICVLVDSGNWRDSIAVPLSWTIADCIGYKDDIGGNGYYLGCVTDNGVVFGEFNGDAPSPNCGWGGNLNEFYNSESLTVNINGVDYAMVRGEEEANQFCIDKNYLSASIYDQGSSTDGEYDRADWDVDIGWNKVKGNTYMKYITCIS